LPGFPYQKRPTRKRMGGALDELQRSPQHPEVRVKYYVRLTPRPTQSP
jgi:hypothetical protein